MKKNWKLQAVELLISRQVTKPLLQGIYKKIVGKTCPSDMNKENIVEGIMMKVNSPQELLTKQEITSAILRSYLQIDSKDTSHSVQELHNAVIQKWTDSDSTDNDESEEIFTRSVPPPTPTSTSSSSTTTTTTKRKREREESTQVESRKQKVQLNNWWKVTNCVTENAYCSGTTETGFVVTPGFANCDVQPGSEIVGEGNIVYVLGNHSQDEDQIEDNFGPWPKKMSSLNAVHLQFRSLQSESITEFSNRLGMSVSGGRLDHLSSSMLLFNTLKLINAIEVKKTLRKAVEGLPGHDAASFPEDLITKLEVEYNVPHELIIAADRVEKLKEELNEECLKVHKILYSKDKKQVLQAAMQRASNLDNTFIDERGNTKDLSHTIYRNRLRSLDACEKRAERCREEAEIEKKAMEAAKRAGAAAQKKQEIEQIRAQIDALEVKISSRTKGLNRLKANAATVDQNIIETTLQLREVRNRMAESVLTRGYYDHHQKTENDALTCSLVGLQETYSCILDHITIEEETLRKEIKQLSNLEGKLEL